ncbi:MAG: hypothetical protein MUE81_21530, partial [Thermoflexibacter sp.]|nr:hypothetical protein [Thermoflexibacter sp.]
MSKKNDYFLFFIAVIFFVLFGCNSSQENNSQSSAQDSIAVDNELAEKEDGIKRQDQSFTMNGIGFTRHQVNIKQGRVEELIHYTVFEDKEKFKKVNELIADFVNLARLDSIRIVEKSPLEDEDSEYEYIQRYDSVYFITNDLITVDFNYSFVANGMECESKENKIVTFSIKKQDIISLKDIFGTKLTDARKFIAEKLRTQYIEAIDKHIENSFTKPSQDVTDEIRQKLQKEDFLNEIYLGIIGEDLIFTYIIGKECDMPPFLLSKIDIKSIQNLLPTNSIIQKP